MVPGVRPIPGPVGLAILVNLAGVFLLDLMGVVIRLLATGPGAFSTAELSAWRNLLAMLPAIVVLVSTPEWHRRGRRLRIRQWRLAALRGAFTACAQLLFYLSLTRLEFATASTIIFSMALFAVAFSVPVLGERVGPARWGAVAIGFAGVVMVMHPGSDLFTFDALLPAGAAALYALSSVTARLVDRDVPTALLNLYSNAAAVAVAGGVALATGGFTLPASSGELLRLVLMGVLGGCGVLCLVISYRLAEPATLAPFNYFGIPFSFGLGWLVFGEAPFERLFPGALLIVAGGLIVVWRTQRRQAAGIAPGDTGAG